MKIKNEKRDFMKKLVNLAFIYLFAGVFMGAFYREFTKYAQFDGDTTLSIVHTHLLVLGFTFTIILLILEKIFTMSSYKHYKKGMLIYNIGVITTVVMMVVRGVTQVLKVDLGAATSAISGIAGLGHIVLTIGFVFIFMMIKHGVSNSNDTVEI